MKLAKISLAITACMGATIAHSAGLERSQQPIAPLFEDGNYAEISYGHVTPAITGKDRFGNTVENMLDDYGMEGAAVKIAPTKNSALMLSYNKPWGVDTTYPTGNMFNNELGATQAHVKAESIGLIVGGKPKGGNVMIYGGVEHQSLSGFIKAATPLGQDKAMASIPTITSVVTPIVTQQVIQGYVDAKVIPSADAFTSLATLAQTNPSALTAEQAKLLSTISTTIQSNVTTEVTNQVTQLALSPTLYELNFEDESTLVPMVGIAFEKPEIAMRTAITYRAPAKYNVKGLEHLTVGANSNANISDVPGNTNVELPQSVSVDFQTGLSAKHQLLGMVNARWVNWSDFEVAPPLNNALRDGAPLASYADDQYSVEVAVAKQFTPKLAAEIRASYDTGTGEDLSILGPYNSVAGIAVGAKYDITDQLEISGGAQYIKIEGGEVASDDPTSPTLTIDDSDGYAVGMKLGYHF